MSDTMLDSRNSKSLSFSQFISVEKCIDLGELPNIVIAQITF